MKVPTPQETYEQAKQFSQETYEQAKHLGQNTASTLGNNIRPLPDDASDKTSHDLLMGDLYREQTPENGEGVDEYCRRLREEASSRADLWGEIESEEGIKRLWETTKQNGQEVFTNSLGSISASLGGAGLALYQEPKVLVVPVAFSGFAGLVGAGWGKAAANKISGVDAERRAELYDGLSDRLRRRPELGVLPEFIQRRRKSVPRSSVLSRGRLRSD